MTHNIREAVPIGQIAGYDDQVEYYIAYIKGHPDQKTASIFADNGTIGINTKNRKEFKSGINMDANES